MRFISAERFISFEAYIQSFRIIKKITEKRDYRSRLHWSKPYSLAPHAVCGQGF